MELFPMVMKPNWWDETYDQECPGGTAEQVGRAIGSAEPVLNAIQAELDRKIDHKIMGASLSQRIGRAVAEALTAR
jgi:hypothetical protein